MTNFVWLALSPIAIVAVYFLWAFVHEFSHYLMAKDLVGVKSVRFRIYPHRHPELGFCWASIGYTTFREPDSFALGRISMAPRIPDIIAAALFPFWICLPEFWNYAWLLVWSGGLVDFGVGSLGISHNSDLQRAARGLGVNPWGLRIVGFTVIVASVAVSFGLWWWK